jgi:hypothetical protein
MECTAVSLLDLAILDDGNGPGEISDSDAACLTNLDNTKTSKGRADRQQDLDGSGSARIVASLGGSRQIGREIRSAAFRKI